MKNILDYNPTIIVPQFQERGHKIMVCIVQISLFTFFFMVPGGRRFITMSMDIIFSGLWLLQIFAVIIAFFFGSAYLVLWANLLWMIMGKEEINVQASSILIKRTCILEQEMKLNFADIKDMVYFHINVKSGIDKLNYAMPFHVGKMKIIMNNGKEYLVGYDISHKDFIRIKQELSNAKKRII